MGRYLVDNGKLYKLVRSFGNERDALVFVDRIEKESCSRRFKPILKRVHWVFADNSWFSRFIHFSRFKVYVPTGKEA
jgi:hypothetical protein